MGKNVATKADLIYKYQAITDYSIENLRDGKLWASKPETFNDPFEFHYHQIGDNPQKTGADKLISQLHNSRVVCLTPNPLNPLMWAHYTDHHRGICLGFEHNIITTAVRYTNDFPQVNFTTDNRNQRERELLHIMWTKSPDWSYEDERRMIFEADADPKVSYPGPLAEVIFGLRTSPEQIAQIREVLEGQKISYYQCYLEPRCYDLGKKEI